MEPRKLPPHPYIPNANPAIREEMLREVGVPAVDDLFADIPPRLRFEAVMNLPPPLRDEASLGRHMEALQRRNVSCKENLCFLGAGCYPHYVPAICDEINQRSEFLTAYAGEPYEDHGRFQTLFEYESMMGELLDFDVVNVPTYNGYQAAATALRMAARVTGRREVLVAPAIDPGKLSHIHCYCRSELSFRRLPAAPGSGQIDLDQLASLVNERTAAVYFENPSYWG